MDWSEERWVKLYTRDTDDWLSLSWDARSVLTAMIRAADRSGTVRTRRGVEGLANVIRAPIQAVETGVGELAAHGTVEISPGGFRLVNYVAAQRARTSDRMRKEMQRERDAADPPPAVTPKYVTDIPTRSEEKRREERETLSQRRGLDRPETLRDRYEAADRLFEDQESRRRRIAPNCRPANRVQTTDQIARLLGAGETEGDLRHVLDVYEAEARTRETDRLRFFNGVTNWRPEQVAIAKSREVPGAPPVPPTETTAPRGAPQPAAAATQALSPEAEARMRTQQEEILAFRRRRDDEAEARRRRDRTPPGGGDLPGAA